MKASVTCPSVAVGSYSSKSDGDPLTNCLCVFLPMILTEMLEEDGGERKWMTLPVPGVMTNETLSIIEMKIMTFLGIDGNQKPCEEEGS